jgi:hypothetical protein
MHRAARVLAAGRIASCRQRGADDATNGNFAAAGTFEWEASAARG